jgi:hypothetical protein
VPALGYEDVRGLDVSVNDALAVSGVQSIGDVDRQSQQRRNLDGLSRDAMPESNALEELHRDKGPIIILADLVNRADVGMVQRRGGARLAAEALQCLWVASYIFGKELERDVSAQIGVFGLVDHAHAATPQLFKDAVVGDRGSKHASSVSGGYLMLRANVPPVN